MTQGIGSDECVSVYQSPYLLREANGEAKVGCRI